MITLNGMDCVALNNASMKIVMAQLLNYHGSRFVIKLYL